jgi:serine/threonine protein phosphatase PrpC
MSSSLFQIGLATAAATLENQDCAAFFEFPTGLWLIIADGAGGLSGGKQAAELLIQIVTETLASETEIFSEQLAAILKEADNRLFVHPRAGETTAVLINLHNNRINGASVGDSGAFLLQTQPEMEIIELTAQQQRKPLLGSGIAQPISFGNIPFTGTLLLATDGLIKYSKIKNSYKIVFNNEVPLGAHLLVESVRYASGNLPDDVTVIVCRKGQPSIGSNCRN